MLHKRRTLLAVIVLLLLAAGLYGLVPRLGSFHTSLRTLKQAHIGTVIEAAAASLTATTLAAGIYVTLAYKRISFGGAVLVQYSGLFVNRVLPAGIGGIGLNFLFLRKSRHTAAQAGTVVALNNFLGFVGHLLLAIVLLGWYILSDHRLSWHAHFSPRTIDIIAGAAAAVLLMLAAVWWRAGTRLRRTIARTVRQLASFYAQHPRKLLTALALSCCLTLANVVSFWLSCRAVGASVSLIVAFVVFTLGVVLMTATPTPGGLGGAEAALVAGLVAEHVPSGTALASALLYRLVSFWLGLVLGALTLPALRARKLI